MNPTLGRPLRLLLATAILLGAHSTPSHALEVVNVSYPSPAPIYIPVAVALHQGVFREQNLGVKLIVTRAPLSSGDIDSILLHHVLKEGR